MAYLDGDIIDEEIIGNKVSWNNEDAIIEKDMLVITKDTNEWRQGDASKLFSELENIYDTTKLANAKLKVNIINPDIASLSNDRISKVGAEYLSQSAYNQTLFDLIYENGKFYDTCSVAPVKVSGSSRKRYGTILKLYADSFSSYLTKGAKITSYEWTLPNDSIVITTNPTLEYTILSDPNLIGDILSFKVRAFDELGNRSTFNNYSVTISNDNLPTIIETTFERIM